MSAKPRARILMLEDDAVMGGSLAHRLGIEGYNVDWVRNMADASVCLTRAVPDLFLSDLWLPDGSGESFFERMHTELRGVPTVFMTAYADIEQAVRLVRGGADDFLTKPLQIAELLERIETLLARRIVPLADAVMGRSPAIRAVEATLRRAAGAESPVLLLGETGVGKEVAARLLHAASPRAAAPFIAINCAAIPAELLESEVFGHERGAFTGAGARHIGYAERAREGVFFLDEVGELPLALQPKLLRLLEARVFQRVGGHEQLPFRARIIAATNADLLARVRQGLFREDLLYRLDVIGVEIPPLRRRGEDILPLAMTFLELSGGSAPRRFDPGAEEALLAHDWPGNARELRNRVERASILADGPAITASDLFPKRIAEALPPTLAASMEAAERITISAALQSAGWDVALAAERLGVGRSTLFDKLRRLGLRRPSDKG